MGEENYQGVECERIYLFHLFLLKQTTAEKTINKQTEMYFQPFLDFLKYIS